MMPQASASVTLRSPNPDDGSAVAALIAACPPLDGNSVYCNLLQCTHFADTCVLAEQDDELAGWVSAYRPPAEPDRLFVWQVAVAPRARGTGLGVRMLDALVRRPAVHGADTLSTTITAANGASWKLFERFARRRGARLAKSVMFDREIHFDDEHDTEFEVTINLTDRFTGAARPV